VNFVRIQEDKEDEVQYVHMEDPSAAEITFVRAPCPRREVLYVGCSDLGMSFGFFFTYSSVFNNGREYGVHEVIFHMDLSSFLSTIPAFFWNYLG
jgi:hypothetical protein